MDAHKSAVIKLIQTSWKFAIEQLIITEIIYLQMKKFYYFLEEIKELDKMILLSLFLILNYKSILVLVYKTFPTRIAVLKN